MPRQPENKLFYKLLIILNKTSQNKTGDIYCGGENRVTNV